MLIEHLRRYLQLLGRPYRRATLGVILLLLPAHLLILRQVFAFLFVNEVVLKSNLDLLVVLAIATAFVVLCARYFYGGHATYLTKGDIVDNPDGTVTLNTRESKTDLVLWQLGASFTIPRSTGR